MSSPTERRRVQRSTHPPKVAQGHGVTFLHGAFASQLPDLHAKLLSLAIRAHDHSSWRLINESQLTVRTIELLDYVLAADSLGWHVDEQSAVTMLVMLSSPTDFEGGQLEHEVRGQLDPVAAKMELGDITVYRSHQAHRVTPLTAGRRRVMAIELWHGEPGSSHGSGIQGGPSRESAGSDPPSAADELPMEDGIRRGRPHRPFGQCPV
uniref:Fe2OG dioxygenase domain-containing protein n=1 Tax=Haptolina ericina TaxID=156174 RepID=A0A7S3B9U9_9EUKA